LVDAPARHNVACEKKLDRLKVLGGLLGYHEFER